MAEFHTLIPLEYVVDYSFRTIVIAVLLISFPSHRDKTLHGFQFNKLSSYLGGQYHDRSEQVYFY